MEERGSCVGEGGGETTAVCCLSFHHHASVSQRQIRLDNFSCCHTEKLQIKLDIASSLITLTLNQSVLALTLECKATGRIVTSLQMFGM